MPSIKCPNCGQVFTVDESGYAQIAQQVRDAEFDKAVQERASALLEKEKSVSEVEKVKAESSHKNALQQKEQEISELKAKLNIAASEKNLAIQKAVSEKDLLIANLKNEVAQEKSERQISEQSMKQQFDGLLKAKDEEIAFYKDFKAKESTKMIGESLEQFCLTEFEKLRATAFKTASFGKDNIASRESGSKGDFIFRDYEDGVEYVSIMFEMKNEADTTATKKTNDKFLTELDKDRREKNCEFAVLVSMLEADNELYNTGIVDVSHVYPKMYVIRPQFFIPMITLLRNAAANSLEYKKQLVIAQNENIDITNFQKDIDEFKSKFAKNVKDAAAQYETAIKKIDAAIEGLEKAKEALRISEKHLNTADNRAFDELNIKRLTKNNPTMATRFKALEDK